LKEFPRVLVVCEASLWRESNTAAVAFGSLFRGWPSDRLRQVYGEEDQEDGLDKNGNWCIKLDSVPGHRLVRRLLSRSLSRGGVRIGAGIPPGMGPGQATATCGGLSLAVARAWADLIPYRISPELWSWLFDLAPELIFSPLGSIRWITLVKQLATRLHVPVIPFFCDDWPMAFYRFSRLVWLPRAALRRRLLSALQDAPIILCGSDAMAREYEERYRVQGLGFMRCVPTTPHLPAPACRKARPLRLLYVGGLHLQRWQVLQRLGDALGRLREEGVEATLSIYAPERDVANWKGKLDRAGLVDVEGTLTAAAVPAALAQADVLVHVESFDEDMSSFTRLSLSTKLPEYMATGRPLLAIGPPGISSIEYIRERGAGLVVDNEASETIAMAVRRLANEPGLREALGHAGWETSCLRHDSYRERERFLTVLACAARGEAGRS